MDLKADCGYCLYMINMYICSYSRVQITPNCKKNEREIKLGLVRFVSYAKSQNKTESIYFTVYDI